MHSSTVSLSGRVSCALTMAAILNLIVLVLSLCVTCADPAGAAVYYSRVSDKELGERKVRCYQDIDNGLWGNSCKASQTEKENCALICVSPTCYDSVYGSDPLEEGEVDLRRGREFKACIHGQMQGDRLAKAKSIAF